MSDIIEALPVLVVTDPNGDGHTAECPHCGERGTDIVREVDKAIRLNTGELVIEDGKIVAASWGLGDTDFVHVRHECDYCGKPVELPEDIDEIFS